MDFPQIDLRETSAGRIAYIAGTRFAVAWVADIVPHDMTAEAFAATYDVPVERIHAALAYARAFPAEIKSDWEQSTENLKWIVVQDAAQRTTNPGKAAAKSGEKGKRAK